ncbi:MAG TPA: amidohydrolase [Candidatus Latescibacteria bacterium]|nr:amidohydrolase [Candidatus Latescibacterota bacterium]|tara:strand:+ start:931 stop:1767 length:837 start_codon:yes stop_codon:yes gene_type:complete
MIIDTHTHFYDPTRGQGIPWPPADNELLYRTVLPAHHRELAQPEGITGTVVVEASAWLDDNQWILDLAADDPWIVGFVGHIDPGEAFAANLARFAEHPLFLGIRLGGRYFDDLHAGTVLQDIEELAKNLLALDVLVRAEQVDAVGAVARLFPELRIVIDHIGHVPIDGNAPDNTWQEAMARIAECRNVYCKVSAVPEQAVTQPAPAAGDYYQPTLDALWRIFGEDHVIFGTNWPVSDRAADFSTVVAIVREYVERLGPEVAAKYWHANARKAYRFVDR